MLGTTIYAPTKTGNIKTWKCSVTPDVNDPDLGPATLTITTRTKLDGIARRR